MIMLISGDGFLKVKQFSFIKIALKLNYFTDLFSR